MTAARPLVLFVRIQKTATTMLHCVVENTLGKEAVLSFGCYDERTAARAINQADRPGLFMASAHMPYGAHLHIERDCEYVTLMRDPVDRVASLYHHVQMPHLTGHWLHLPGASLEQWLAHHRQRCDASICNTATRYLCGGRVENGPGQRFSTLGQTELRAAAHNLAAGSRAIRAAAHRPRELAPGPGRRD
ncbi:MAG: sulfotransferase domain-containing protein [Deltaproteobacteria bacterium]|nr:sulfotransferase domain-containing protein [Deltaproteobacteria bacterium]